MNYLSLIRYGILGIFLISTTVANATNAKVQAEFLEVYSGKGRGYPIFFVVEKNENIKLIKRKTDWIQIQSSQGRIGWINDEDYVSAVHLVKPDIKKQVINANWELGLSAGTFGSDKSYAVAAGYQIKPVIAIQAEWKKVIGSFSYSNILSGQFLLQPLRQYFISPFVTLGLGRMENTPRNSLVNAVNTQTNVYQYGGGVNYIPYKRLNLRLSIRSYYMDKSEKSYLDIQFGVHALFG